jgi:hypothetical protein
MAKAISSKRSKRPNSSAAVRVRGAHQGLSVHLQRFGEALDQVDARGIDAPFKGADIGAIDADLMGELLLGQALRLAQPLQIGGQNLSNLHRRESTAL